MKLAYLFNSALTYLMEAAGRIFSPTDDSYPNTGVQPYSGDPWSDWFDLY